MLPTPLALPYRRYQEENREPALRLRLLVDVFDVTVRLLAFIALAEYLHRFKDNLPKVDELLDSGLEKPLLSHWNNLFQTTLHALDGANHGYTIPELVRLNRTLRAVKSPATREIWTDSSPVLRRRSLPLFDALLHTRNTQAHRLTLSEDRAKEFLLQTEPLVEQILLEAEQFFSRYILCSSGNSGHMWRWQGPSSTPLTLVGHTETKVFLHDTHGLHHDLSLDPLVRPHASDANELMLFCGDDHGEIALESSRGRHPEVRWRSTALRELRACKSSLRWPRKGVSSTLEELRRFASWQVHEALRALIRQGIDPSDPRVVVPAGISQALQGFEYDAGCTGLILTSASGTGRTTWIARHLQQLPPHSPALYYQANALRPGELLSTKLVRDVLGREIGEGGTRLDDFFERLHLLAPHRVFVVLDDLHRFSGRLDELIGNLAEIVRTARAYRWFRLIVSARAVTLAPYEGVFADCADVLYTAHVTGSVEAASRSPWFPIVHYDLQELEKLYDLHMLHPDRVERDSRPPSQGPHTAFCDLDERWHVFLRKPSFLRVLAAAFPDGILPRVPHAETVMNEYEDLALGGAERDHLRDFIDRLVTLLALDSLTAPASDEGEILFDEMFRREPGLHRLHESVQAVYPTLLERDVLTESVSEGRRRVRFVHRSYLAWKLSQRYAAELASQEGIRDLTERTSGHPLAREAVALGLARRSIEDPAVVFAALDSDLPGVRRTDAQDQLLMDVLVEAVTLASEPEESFREFVQKLQRAPAERVMHWLLRTFHHFITNGSLLFAERVADALEVIVRDPAARPSVLCVPFCKSMVAYERLLASSQRARGTSSDTASPEAERVFDAFDGALRGLGEEPLQAGHEVVALGLEQFCELLDGAIKESGQRALLHALTVLKPQSDARIRLIYARLAELIVRRHARHVSGSDALLDEARAIASEVDAVPLRVHCLLTQSYRVWWDNKVGQADELLAEAQELLGGTHDDYVQGRLFGVKAVYARQKREIGDAVTYAREHLRHFQNLRHRDGTTPLNNLGTYLGEAGRFAESHECFQELREIHDRQGKVEKVAKTHLMEAVLYLREGDPARARESLDFALQVLSEPCEVQCDVLWLYWNIDFRRDHQARWKQARAALATDIDALQHILAEVFPIGDAIERGELENAFEQVCAVNAHMDRELKRRPEDWGTPLWVSVRLAERLAAESPRGHTERLARLAEMARNWVVDDRVPHAPFERLLGLAEKNRPES